METLNSTLYTTKPTIWNHKNPIQTHHKTIRIEYKNKIWRLHAEPKGFSSRPPVDLQQLKNKQRDSKSNKDDDDDEKIPDEVFERMIVRILSFVGVPLVTGLVLLKVFGAIKEQHLWDVPIWLPFLTTFVTFGCSTLGIAYGTLSTSWEVDKKGSILGFEQAQKNWDEMWSAEEDDQRR